MEDGVTTGRMLVGIVRAGSTPVEIKITGDGIAVDDPLGGFIFVSGNLRALLIVLAIQTVRSGETCRPVGHILHRAGAGLLPGTALEGIAVEGGIIGGRGFDVRITVLRLGIEQRGIHTLGNLLQPGERQLFATVGIAVAAKRAGVFKSHLGNTVGLNDF